MMIFVNFVTLQCSLLVKKPSCNNLMLSQSSKTYIKHRIQKKMAKLYILTTIFVILLGVFLNYPAPELSNNLKRWKEQGKYLNYGDNRIFYIDSQGQGMKDDVVICLHGFPTSSYDWKEVWPRLHETFGEVVTLDFLGFGFSDKPKSHNYSIMEQADIAEKLLLHLNVKEVHILAHDYGDTVAQELLYRFDTKKLTSHHALAIKSVCLLNGGILPETHYPRFGQKILMNPWLAPVASRLMNYASFKRGLGEVFGSRTQPRSNEMWDYWTAVRFNDGDQISHRLLRYVPERFANRDRWVGVLQTTSVPVRVIYGPADPVNPKEFVDRYRELIPHGIISRLDSHISHYPQVEDPVSTMGAYRQFLESNHLIDP
ncbi:mesoderm-specific transcript homolog protein-like isoform X2 [Ptychodera flava]|uniref:mesoderm-specific transcript homolog protein-like isoform X2 n=2 Tax=Ptychodera flava TaxID=63121 RepID=UPI003969F8BE